MNEYIESVVAEAKSYIGVKYVLGGTAREGIDCRGLVRKAFGNVGLRDLIGGALGNVRAFAKWSKDTGHFYDATHPAARGDLVFYEDATPPASEPGNPLHLRHMGLVLQPISAKYPKGRVISAVVPRVTTHHLKLKSLKVHGYGKPDWPMPLPEPPIEDPEPAVKLSAADNK